jgi:Ni,Fe-hydrogenase III large subunit
MTGSEGSDITQLWQKAVQEYEKTTGRNLQLGGFRSMDEVMEGTEGQMIKFKDFRDNRGKASKVRTALKNNMWLIQKIVNTIQVVGNTASVSSIMANILTAPLTTH